MRIAFVGKGGSGKTTTSSIFASFLKNNEKTSNRFAAIDADINMHLANNLGIDTVDEKLVLSDSVNSKNIREFLIGNNDLIDHINSFRKTTPPTRKSNLINWSDKNSFIYQFSQSKEIPLFVVGTYEEEEIGFACYHNTLLILENILSHSNDDDFYLVLDMVAGTDAFATTLFSQIDILFLVVEPTLKGVAVYDQYKKLSEFSDVFEKVFVVVNKVKTDADIDFVKQKIDSDKIVAFFRDSNYLNEYNRIGGFIDSNKLEKENIESLNIIFEKINSFNVDKNKRLKNLHDLHIKYSNMSFIKDKFGDLTKQIDQDFKY